MPQGLNSILTYLTESSVDDEDPTPYLFESDATAVRTFVRELVTQSIVPSMERSCATWNEQVATRRRGISGKLMSLSKRWTPFGSSNRNVSSPTGTLIGRPVSLTSSPRLIPSVEPKSIYNLC